jgi:hypothetical protein
LLNATLLNEMAGDIEATSNGVVIPCARARAESNGGLQ